MVWGEGIELSGFFIEPTLQGLDYIRCLGRCHDDTVHIILNNVADNSYIRCSHRCAGCQGFKYHQAKTFILRWLCQDIGRLIIKRQGFMIDASQKNGPALVVPAFGLTLSTPGLLVIGDHHRLPESIEVPENAGTGLPWHG